MQNQHPFTDIHDHSFFWIGTGTSIKRGGIKLVLWAQTFGIVLGVSILSISTIFWFDYISELFRQCDILFFRSKSRYGLDDNDKLNDINSSTGIRNCPPFRAPEVKPVFSGVRVIRYLVLRVMFCRSLFVVLYFFVWPLCCLSFDLRILITSLWYIQTCLPTIDYFWTLWLFPD